MAIREATIKDLLTVVGIIKDVIFQSQRLGSELFTEDANALIAGAFEFAVLAINNDNSVILIDEDENGDIKGMIAGGLQRYPNFYRHTLVGEVTCVHPVSFASRNLYTAFEEWRIGKGATATTGFVQPENGTILKLYDKHGMKLAMHWVLGSFQEKTKCLMSSDVTE